MAQPDASMILWDVIEEHFNEAEFLFDQWERALQSPRYNLTELGATLERRLEAHLDGLLVGGPAVAERVLIPELANAEEPTRAIVAALVLLYAETEMLDAVVDSALHADGVLQKALARALTLASVDSLDRILLEGFHAAAEEPQKAILLDILTSRRVDVGEVLRRCVESGCQQLVGAALTAIGRFGRRDLSVFAEKLLRSENLDLRTNALRAGLTLGSSEAWRVCRQMAELPHPDDPNVMLYIAILGEPKDHEILYSRLEAPANLERALWTIGFCGTVRAGDVCLARLESDEERVAKAAAESMAWIGGLDLNDERFRETRAVAAEEEALPPLELEDLDGTLEEDGFDELPVPNRGAVGKWWQESRGKVSQHRRLRMGCPDSPAAVLHALESGPLWRRHGVALELCIRSGGASHVQTDTFSPRQRRQMSAIGKA
ncbi:MAG: TIGR02270 family protein [Bryobacterales bacterium]|nr:TIGR02270 family protein [Bryobacterales bacterium]